MTDPKVTSLGRRHFDFSAQTLAEAVRRVQEDDAPDVINRLGVVLQQCDALKASALAYAGEVEMSRNLTKPRPK